MEFDAEKQAGGQAMDPSSRLTCGPAMFEIESGGRMLEREQSIIAMVRERGYAAIGPVQEDGSCHGGPGPAYAGQAGCGALLMRPTARAKEQKPSGHAAQDR